MSGISEWLTPEVAADSLIINDSRSFVCMSLSSKRGAAPVATRD